MKTLEPPSSAGAIHATSQIGGRGPLWTTQRREAPAACLMRWVAQPLPVSCGSSSGPPTACSSKTHPSKFLSIYIIVMQAAGAHNDKVLTNYFSLALKPNVMSWLMHLPADSISSWSDLCHEFVGAFTGGHQAHGQASDFHIIP